ncbi:MAG: hypothetical protein ACXV8O_07345 [Methylobacter sp.]
MACSLKPQNQPIDVLPHLAPSSKTYWRISRLSLQTRKGGRIGDDHSVTLALRLSNIAINCTAQWSSSSTPHW